MGRLIECEICGQQIQLNNLPDHLTNVYGWAPLKGTNLSQPQKIIIPEKKMAKFQHTYEVPFQNKNLTFFKNWVQVDETSYMFWMSYGGPKNDAQKYEYTIMIKYSKDRTLEMAKSLLKATTCCVPCDVSHEEMKKRKEAIMISKELVERATEGLCCTDICNRYLHYVFTIGFT